MKRLILSAALAFLAAGCTTRPTASQGGQLEPIDMGDHPPLTMLPDPEHNGGHTGRAPRRLTVAQLKQSIQITTGTQWSRIDALAASMGQADYALTVSDATEPNLVFAKFLEDGAREVCIRAAQADLTRAQSARILWPDIANNEAGTNGRDFTLVPDASVERNLNTLSVRFWGQPFSDAERAEWLAMYKGIAARAKAATPSRPEQVWGAMCIAFMTDPRFITY